MKKMKYLLLALVVASMCLGLCACGSSDKEQEPQVNQEQTDDVADNKDEATENEETSDTTADGTVTYTVKVVDENGAPVANAAVQLCKEACIPSMTDAEGVAIFNLAEDEYKVSFVMLPAGYTYSGEEDTFYFEDGSREMTITLKAA